MNSFRQIIRNLSKQALIMLALLPCALVFNVNTEKFYLNIIGALWFLALASFVEWAGTPKDE